MKNRFSKYIVATLIFSGAASLTSCEKEFLDDPKPTASVSSIDAFSNEQSVRAYFTGVYNQLRSWYVNHDTDGAKSYDLAFDLMGNDFIQPVNNWYGFDYQNDNRNSTYRRVSFTWNFHYNQINDANLILEGIQTADIPASSKTAFEAEAKAIRAWAYFNLIRAYQHTYLKDKAAPGVPIYTTPTTAETKGNPRASVEEVYALITSDLEFAVQNLSNTSRGTKKFEISKSVASGLLARAYLTMGEWAKAENAAFTALASYGVAANTYTEANIVKALRAADYATGFNDDQKAEWLWGLPERADQSLYYRSFFSHIDMDRTAGYKSIYMNTDFVNLFSATDVRKLFVTKSNGFTATTKFRDFSDLSGDFVMMRSAEMVLIIAEARAEQADLTNAKAVLYSLQKNRDPNAIMSANAIKDAIINEILVERRKELYGEIGVQVQDVKRRQLSLTRTGSHRAALRVTYPANWKNFIYQIPSTEIDINENIGPEDQNE